MNEEEYIGTIININNKLWRVAEKVLTREWKYTLSHEKTDGSYESMRLNESALEQIVKSGSKVIDNEIK
jgi:hypothetical protein|tara:strand:+ start:67 stop:273 length:207 start_codon:yes stop_codon:yes gene_type:complete